MRTTVRSLKREPEVSAMLKEGGADPQSYSRLSFFAADLEDDAVGPKPSPAASMCCMWRRHFRRMSRRTTTNSSYPRVKVRSACYGWRAMPA